MKILIYSQNYFPEPFRPQFIAEELVSLGHIVTVVTGLPNTSIGKIQKEYRFLKKRNEYVNGVKVIRVPIVAKKNKAIFLGLNYLSYFLFASLRTFFLSWKYDVVFAYQLTPVTQVLPAILYKKLHRKKLVTYCLDLWPENLVSSNYVKKTSLIYKSFYKLSKWIYKNSDTILLSSKSFQDYFTEYLNVPAKKLFYWPQFAEDINVNSEINDVTILNDEDFNIVFAGNIGKVQNLDHVLEAMRGLKHREDIKLYLLGDGSAKDELFKYKEDNELDNVIFLGRKPLEAMPIYYNKAHLLLVSIKDDGLISKTLPGKVQSYMKFGKPIIGLAGGETKLIVDEANCGICLESNDIEGFIFNLENFKKSDLNRYGQNAKNYYDNNFNKDYLITKLLTHLIN